MCYMHNLAIIFTRMHWLHLIIYLHFSGCIAMHWYFHDVLSCDQAALRTLPCVRPSLRPSVCPSVTPFSCSHHRIIMKFSGVITNDRSDVHVNGQGQRSEVKVTEVKTQYSRFRTVIPVWIHIWSLNYAQSSMWVRRGAVLFFMVNRQISRSHG